MSENINTLPINLSIPDSFYQEEERCNYTVSKEMKRVWAVELDLLVEFDRVCRKYSFPYVATGGTLLGAVRHKGFIPWDDDIDLGMKREHYQKLCEVAQQEFKHPYFFQTEWTDPTSFRGHAQLRNSNTTAILKYEHNKRINQGIFIDIFPLDNVIDDINLLAKQMELAKSMKSNIIRSISLTQYTDFYDGKRSIKNRIKSIVKYLLYPFNGLILKKCEKWYAEFESICQKYNDRDTEFLGMLSFLFDEKKLYIESNGFEKSISYVDFEFSKIPILSYYEKLLTRQYGNWRTPVKLGSYHDGFACLDAEKSYKETLK